MFARQFQGAPGAFAAQRRDCRPGPGPQEERAHAPRESGLAQENASGKHKPHRRAFSGQLARAIGRVPGQGLGPGRQNPGGELVPAGRGVEYFHGEGGDFRFGGARGPADQIFRGVELQRAENALSELWPPPVAVQTAQGRLDTAKADFVAAAPVAQNMAPAAHAGGAIARRAAKAA